MNPSFFGLMANSAETLSAELEIPLEFGTEKATRRGVQKSFAIEQATEYALVFGVGLVP